MSKTRSNSGFALVTVLIGLALLTTIGVALSSVGAVEYRSAMNHRSATRALLLADAGATRSLALLRGPLGDREYSEILVGADGEWDTADDGYLYGYGLSAVEALPDTGVLADDGGRYWVRIVNDDADPSGDPAIDTNHQFLARCRAETPDGGRAEIGVLFRAAPFPAVASNGRLLVPGNPVVNGECSGGIHSNGDMEVSGTPTVDGSVTATGDMINSGTIRDSDGYVVTPKGDQPPIDIPEYQPFEMGYCDEADYRLENGKLINVSTGAEEQVENSKVLGWKWSPSSDTYELAGKDAVPGTVCADGNIQVNGNLGGAGDTLGISLLARGSVKVGGNPIIKADHSEGILIMAEGDVQIGGNPSGNTPFYSGMVYSGSQCQVNGNPVVTGHVLCYDGSNPVGSDDFLYENKVNGNPLITYDCTGLRQRTAIAAWWESRAR